MPARNIETMPTTKDEQAFAGVRGCMKGLSATGAGYSAARARPLSGPIHVSEDQPFSS